MPYKILFPVVRVAVSHMYVKTGDSVDIDGNLLSATSYDGENLRDAVVTDTNINTSVPGQYEVHYRCTDSSGRSCHKVLTVIVG